MGLAGEFWGFMRHRKKWWLLPVIVVMVVVGALLVFAVLGALMVATRRVDWYALADRLRRMPAA